MMDRNALIGLTTGGAFMFGFGIVWLLIGLFRGNPLPIWVKLALLFAGSVLGASLLGLARRAMGAPQSALSAPQIEINREIARHFYLIFGAELAAIFVAVIVLSLLKHPDYILCGVALIVAVHFFPLAALFKAPFYYGTALAGTAIGLGGFFIERPELRQRMVALSFGVLLWVTASWVVWIGLSGSPAIRS
jgi:hypothetical protein